MNMFNKMLSISSLIAVGMVASMSNASATLLDGNDMRIRYLYPDLSSDYFAPIDVTVGPGIEASFGSGTPVIDISDSTIFFDFSIGGGSAAFNGFQFIDLNNLINSFTSVSVLDTNLAFTDSDISFDADNIWVNFAGLSSGSDGFIELTIDAAVPEPSILALMALGIAGLGFTRRRKQ